MSRALTVAAVLLGGPVALYWIFRWLGEHARWSGVSPDKQARIRAEEAGLDWLPEQEPVPAAGTWTHEHGSITYVRALGEPCGSCGASEESP